MMPIHGRSSSSPATAWRMIGLAMLIGMAKKMPCAPSAKAVLTPMTVPVSSTSGPPELPGLMAASVWIRLRRRASLAGDRIGHRELPARAPR